MSLPRVARYGTLSPEPSWRLPHPRCVGAGGAPESDVNHPHRRRTARPAPLLALLALAALLVPAGSAVAPASATAPADGLCAFAAAIDPALLDPDVPEELQRFTVSLFAEEGIALVAGRPGVLTIQVGAANADECDATDEELAAEFLSLGPPFTSGFLPFAPDVKEVRAVLTLRSGGETVDWAVLGGLEGAPGTSLTVDPDDQQASVDLDKDAFSGLSVLLGLDLPENAAGEYRIDIELLVWSLADDPSTDDPTGTVKLELDLVVGPPVGMCLATLLLDADAYEAALAAAEARFDELVREFGDLSDELDELTGSSSSLPTPEESERIAEIEARLDEIDAELDALAFGGLGEDELEAVVTELGPSSRLLLSAYALPLFASNCATLLGPDAVFVPSTAGGGTDSGSLTSIDDLEIRAVLERDGVEVAWDTVGDDFTYGERFADLLAAASGIFELDVDGAALGTRLVPAPGPLGVGFVIDTELVAAEDLTPGAHTIRATYLDVDDPSEARTVGTTTSTFTVPAHQGDVVTSGGSETAADEVAGTLECSAPVVGSGGSCTLTATPGRTFTWEASTNPVFATGHVTTDASGAGAFAFDVPASLLGQQIVVRVIGVAGSAAPIGVASPPVPTAVPAGEGRSSFAPAGVLFGALVAVLASALAGQRRGRRGSAAERLLPASTR